MKIRVLFSKISEVYVLEMKPKYRYIQTVNQTFHINCVKLDFGLKGRDSANNGSDSPDFYVEYDVRVSLFGNRIPLPNAVTAEGAFPD